MKHSWHHPLIVLSALAAGSGIATNMAFAGSRGTLGFEMNRGQLGAEVLYSARAHGYGVEIGTAGFAILPSSAEAARIDVQWRDGDHVSPHAEGLKPGALHYYLGSAPTGWIRDVELYERIRYREIYPGIDVVLHWFGDQLEVDVELTPNADPGQIALAFSGADRVSMTADGGLELASGGGELRWTAPVVYQRSGSQRHLVSSRQYLDSKGLLRFEIADHDPSLGLVIDPVVLGSSSRFGGSGFEDPFDIAVDDLGTRVVTGGTSSTDFMGIPAAATLGDAFVVRTAADGTLVYAAVLGGDGFDLGWGVAVDGAGNAVVAGHTESTDFPTVNAYQANLSGGADAFLVRLDPLGNLTYATYFGSPDLDGLFDGGVGWHSSGRVYLASRTEGTSGLPTSAGAFQTSCTTAPCGFVAGLDPALSGAASFVYGTYLSGNSSEGALALAVDAAETVYVFGFTASSLELVDPAQAFQAATGDVLNRDHFLLRLDPSLSGAAQRVYSTYIGGHGDETEAGDIHVDDAGGVWVVGDTDSSAATFPLKNAYQPVNAGGADGYIAAVDTTQTGAASLRWLTFMGGSESDEANGVGVDSGGSVWVGLQSRSHDLALLGALPQFEPPIASIARGVVVALSGDGQHLELSTPVPGVVRLRVDVADRVHLLGASSELFPVWRSLPPFPEGGRDGFVGWLQPFPDRGLSLEVTATAASVATGQSFAFRYEVSNSSLVTRTGITLVSDIPAAMAVGSFAAECTIMGAQLECPLPDLEPGENVPVLLTGSSGASGLLTVNAQVDGNEADLDMSDNTASAGLTIGGTAMAPPLELADFDAVAYSQQIGELAIETADGVLATANGSLDAAVNLMTFDGALPLRLVDILGQGEIAVGYVERTTWTPSDGDGGDLFGRDFNAPADRVFAIVDQWGRVELRSGAAGAPGILVDEGVVDLFRRAELTLDLDIPGTNARVLYGGAVVAEGDPFTADPGAASAAAVGDDQVISVAFGLDTRGVAELVGPEVPIFVDDFESGNFSGWSSAVPTP